MRIKRTDDCRHPSERNTKRTIIDQLEKGDVRVRGGSTDSD